MELVSVCFPSGWVPKEKLGKHLSAIHEPIADSEQLIKASDKLSDYMTKQSIKRWVWTITTSEKLSEFPEHKKPELSTFENLFFRVETQTASPLDDLTSLFFRPLLQDLFKHKHISRLDPRRCFKQFFFFQNWPPRLV